jgi:hypothetical protein
MKNVSMVAGLALALGMTSLLGAATASADAQGDYVYDLTNHGIGGPRQNLLQLGQDVACKVSPQDAAVNAVRQKSDLSQDDATFLYESAKTFLCP